MMRVIVCILTMILPTLPASAQEKPPPEAQEEDRNPANAFSGMLQRVNRAVRPVFPQIIVDQEMRVEVRVGEQPADPPPRPAVPQAMGGIPDQILQQYVQQLRPLVRGDLHLIRSLCELTDEERQQLSDSVEELLPELAAQYFTSQQNNVSPRDPYKLVSQELATVAETILTPERVAAFRAEIEARDEARKHAVSGVIVAAIDKIVILSAEQRDTLRSALCDSWNEGWLQAAELLSQTSPPRLPAIPEEILSDVLNETQLQIWRSQAPSNIRIGGIFIGQQIDNTALEFVGELQDDPPGVNSFIIDTPVIP